jgi:polyribonucleotide nucleotidyltransferase
MASQAQISKKSWNDSIRAFTNKIIADNEEQYPDKGTYIAQVVDQIVKRDMRRMILETSKRLDGRGLDQIRPITCEVGVCRARTARRFLLAVRPRVWVR